MTGSALFVARAQLRRRWRATVALTIFVGLAGGLSLSLIGGSRRSSSVVDRYFAVARHYDVTLYPAGTQREVLALPGVVRADPAGYLGMVATQPSGRVIAGINGQITDWSALDPTTQILEGKVPDGSDPSEVLVNKVFVEQFGLSVGDTVHVRMFGLEQIDQVSSGVYEPTGPRYVFRITGIERSVADIGVEEVHSLGHSAYGQSNGILVSNDFYDPHRAEFLNLGTTYEVQLRDGDRVRERFDLAASELRPVGEGTPQVLPALNATQQRGAVDTPVQIETTALLALGIGLALAGAIATALILRAEQRSHDDDTPTLRTLGCTASQLGAHAALRSLPVALGGACIAVGVVLALSARYPIGVGRQLELEPGFQVDLAVLLLGALAVILLVIGSAFLFGRPRRTHVISLSKVGAFARWLGGVGAPTDLTVAAHLAFDRGRGVRPVPSRQAIAGGAAVLAVLTAVGTFIAGVDQLHRVPAAHGWPWDASIGNQNFPLSKVTATKVAADPRMAAHTTARYGVAMVDGKPVEFLAFDQRGDAPPEIVAGRLPETASEVALGGGSMRELEVHLGSTVTFSVANSEFDAGRPTNRRTMRVVGKALPPVLGESDVGKVGIITFDGIAAAGGDDGARLELVRLVGGATPARLAVLDRDYTEEILTDVVPAKIANLHRVRGLPLIGIAIASLMGLFVLMYTLAVGVRARTRDLAVLRAIGLPARRVRRVLAWQGTVLGVGMALVGIPVGLLLGSAIWGRVTDQLGVHPGVVVTPTLLLVGPITVLFAIGASLYPGRRASREQITALLRAE